MVELIEKATDQKKIKERLKPIAREHRRNGEEYKIIARPLQRRAKIETTYNFNVPTERFVFSIRAIDEKGNPLEVTRIWTTINGDNTDLRRPTKGKGEAGFLGPYTVEFTPDPNGISKLKVQTAGDRPSVVFYQATVG